MVERNDHSSIVPTLQGSSPMLICPQCKKQNPLNNKFCQYCGTSLTKKNCPACGTEVSISQETCDECGTVTAKILWAVLQNQNLQEITTEPPSSSEIPSSDPIPLTTEEIAVPSAESEFSLEQENESIESVIPKEEDDLLLDHHENREPMVDQEVANVEDQTETEHPEELMSEMQKDSRTTTSAEDITIALTPGTLTSLKLQDYVDKDKRYRLFSVDRDRLISILVFPQNNSIVNGRVVDTQPFRKSFLDIISEDENSLSDFRGIPSLAEPYLTLETELFQKIPKVHDAWQEGNLTILLLEDRSSWQSLDEAWSQAELPQLQMLSWLLDLTKIWTALSSEGFTQSLLEPNNLKLDEDQVICLQQLYPNLPEEDYSLKRLVGLWKSFYEHSGKTQFGAIIELFQLIEEEKITTSEEILIAIKDIAQQEGDEENLSFYGNEIPLSLTEEVERLPDRTEDPDNFDRMLYTHEGDDQPTVVLPMQLRSLSHSGLTDIGRQRDHNEDYFGINTWIEQTETPLGKHITARGLYVVCDGMGGHASGEVASQMAVDTLERFFDTHWQDEFPSEDLVTEAILTANQTLYEINHKNSRSGSGRMGTTLVMVLVQDTKAMIAHVGDSRIYRINRKWGLEQLTVDHEVGQREIQRGVEPEIAYSRPDAYQLTQALGPRDNSLVRPDIQTLELNEDTLFLLCSDGLSDNQLIENYWETYLDPLIASNANLEQGVMKLIEFANEYNGHDNITALLIRVKLQPNLS